MFRCGVVLAWFCLLPVFSTAGYSRNNQTDSLRHEYYSRSLPQAERMQRLESLLRNLLRQNGDKDTISKYLQVLFENARRQDNDSLLATAWYLRGKFMITLIDYDQAMNSFVEAGRIYSSLGRRREQALTNMQYGIVLYAGKDFNSAIRYFNTAYSALVQEQDTMDFITCKYLVGLSLMELGHLDSAEVILNESRALCRTFGYEQRENESLLGLANVYLLTSRFRQAGDSARKVLDFARRVEPEGTPNQITKARAELSMGKAAFHLQQYDSAERWLSMSLQHASLAGRVTECIAATEAIIDLFTQTGNLDKALIQSGYLMLIKDSLAQGDARRNLQLLEDRQRIALQESRIELLTAQRERDKVVRISLIVLAILLLSLAMLWFQKFKLRREANRKLDDLLLNILPASTASELKEQGYANTRHYREASVLFADIVAFTRLSEKLNPETLVSELHECFSAFDRIIQAHGLEKIKTIGDAYMAAGGVPEENATHAADCVKAAFDMLDFIRQYNVAKPPDLHLEIRVGIHCGELVAGVVGLKKFAYDIWGDTVNIAARLEQAGEPGKVNVSEQVCELIKPDFTCTSRGHIHARYKGEIKMYFVNQGNYQSPALV